MHNLRDINVDIPRDSLVVMTGVSGSGKSSLAFDTLFAEGQRRYLESLSTYTRQFLNQLGRPDADLIDGLPPTISVDQRAGSPSRRSTLATATEIYDYLRLLYARAGRAHCIGCGRPVMQQSPQAIVEQILALEERRKVMILAPLVRGRKGLYRDVFERISKEGFVRARADGQIVDVANPPEFDRGKLHDVEAVIDRIVVKDGIRTRLHESVELALKHGEGTCLVSYQEGDAWHDRFYSSRFACSDCGLSFPELEPRTFSFNSPYGACEACQGLGVTGGQSAVGSRQSAVDSRQEAEGSREGPDVCAACGGSRLGPFARAVTLADVPIHELTAMTVADAAGFVDRLLDALETGRKKGTGPICAEHPAGRSGKLDLSPFFTTPEGRLAAGSALPDIVSRLRFLRKVGLDYLTLDRPTRTLSGGEFQRARLAGCLGAGLFGVCYILDEPTIGLHPRDVGRLIETLEELRDQGNSVLVVEHDGQMMRRSDHLIDLGPGAGSDGGRIVAAGTPDEVAGHAGSITGRYLSGAAAIGRPSPVGSWFSRRRPIDREKTLTLTGARLHNLKDVTLRVPLEAFTCVTGVSGSGKSSLITETLTRAVRRALADEADVGPEPGPFDLLTGAGQLERIVEIDQSPLGRTGRSNPATYSGVWGEVRKVFAKTREARLRGYTARRFSFNAKQGRCAECSGQGTKRIEMNFMPDMHVICPRCKGARFNRQTLAIRFRGKNAADVLAMRIEEAAGFFENFSKLHTILTTFVDMGLGYLCLGQSSLTLSGGEAQRVKLATELSRSTSGRTLFVLDEPSTGLHAADVEKLIALCQRLVDRQNSVLVIEHQLDVIAAADWVIDLGPEGGEAGGNMVAEGPPSKVAQVEASHTARALKEYFAGAVSGPAST